MIRLSISDYSFLQDVPLNFNIEQVTDKAKVTVFINGTSVYATTLLRLAILPVGVHFLMKQMGFAPMVVNINTLVIAMPVATYGTILCLKYGKDTTMITEVTFITTLASMITIPLLVTLLF